ncbi:DoxX-like family protein [Flavobacterium selenitireducens]|uniref:DoxX-like family protein n=1 Tax=Flavobacterium selenitireducens TaxID=2722704 RepID=UPI00168ADBED|nr:DoxX-like family protein [Flavobacterium selenitireducens]MBD3580898.1 hypothetical protein [Flavobacterium selenitireducens]
MIKRNGIGILTVSVGLVFFWFGFLKFFGSLSAADEIASRTISWLTLGYLNEEISMPVLGVIECVIGLGILTRKFMKYVIHLMYFQMAGTLLPLAIFTSDTWKQPFVPTLEGQYIIKNSILISVAIVLHVISKGGKLIADPEVAQKAEKDEERKK